MGIGIPIINLRRSDDRRRFMIEIPIPIRRCRGRDAYQISKRYDHHDIQSRGFETSRDLAVRRPSA